MKYKLFRILIIFFSKLIVFFCYFKSSYSIAFILFLTLRKNKLINYSSKIKKNCIVLDKSFGIDDLQSAFKNTKSNIQFYMLQRILIRKMFNFYFRDVDEKKFGSEQYISNDKKVKITKLQYKNFIKEILINLNKFIKIDGFISFNPFYVAERELQNACADLNINFLVCHKEGIVFGKVNKIRKNYWRERYGNINIKALSVYNKYTKKAFIDSKIITENKISVIGLPRSDEYFISKNKINENYILFLMVQNTAGLPYPGGEWYTKGITGKYKKVNWSYTALKTTKLLINFAKKRGDIKFIFKTKPNYSKKEISIYQKSNLMNCKLIEGGSSINLIKNAKIIIALNTTGILEGMLMGKKIIIPNFEKNLKLYKDFFFNPKKNAEVIYNEKKFENKIEEMLSRKKNQIDKKQIQKINKKYIDNINGNSGSRLKNFILKNL